MSHLKMIIFTSKDCPTCKHLKKSVLPQFVKANPDLKIEEVLISLDGSGEDEAAEARADAYGVQSVPRIFFEIEGLPEGDASHCSLSGLTQLHKSAKEALSNATKK